jgi:CRISPR/Cas system-associated exonuclease Cas4 (RecB family)
MKLQQLNEAAKVKKGLGLSLSKIKMYENCAYRYFLQYIAKEKFDRKANNPKFFKIGQFAHKYIESKIKGIECKFDSETLTDEDKQKTMGNCQSVFENPYIKGLLDKGEAERGFSMYIDVNEPDGLSATDKYSRSADFSGYIDFFVKDGGTLHLIDWKTGGIKGSDDDTFMQLYLYAKAMEKLEGGSKFILSYFYVDHGKIVTKELTKSDLDKKIESVVNKGISIPTQNNSQLFPANPGNVCKYCPYATNYVCKFKK